MSCEIKILRSSYSLSSNINYSILVTLLISENDFSKMRYG